MSAIIWRPRPSPTTSCRKPYFTFLNINIAIIVRDLNLAKHSLKVKKRSVSVSHVGSVFREILSTKRCFQDFLTTEDLAYCKILCQRKKWSPGCKVYNLFETSDLSLMSSERRITTTIWR